MPSLTALLPGRNRGGRGRPGHRLQGEVPLPLRRHRPRGGQQGAAVQVHLPSAPAARHPGRAGAGAAVRAGLPRRRDAVPLDRPYHVRQAQPPFRERHAKGHPEEARLHSGQVRRLAEAHAAGREKYTLVLVEYS